MWLLIKKKKKPPKLSKEVYIVHSFKNFSGTNSSILVFVPLPGNLNSSISFTPDVLPSPFKKYRNKERNALQRQQQSRRNEFCNEIHFAVQVWTWSQPHNLAVLWWRIKHSHNQSPACLSAVHAVIPKHVLQGAVYRGRWDRLTPRKKTTISFFLNFFFFIWHR